ncbi:MAG: DUF6065 family protein [Pseudomonadota bacterium]
MKITARCHPLLEPILPKPVRASKMLPGWLRDMPSTVAAETLAGEEIRTIKHCPPFIDALSLGVMIPLSTDITVEGGAISWDWDPPIISDSPITRSPIGIHAPEQVEGAPLRMGEGLIVKFNNHWTLETEPGWSLLFSHPFNRPDLPFQTLTGVVDTDGFGLGYVQFPSVWRQPDFEGVISAGTPIAQVIPVRRGEEELVVEAMSSEHVAENAGIVEAIEAGPGVYRKDHRR